jgi:membrane peptidoglycan carboxypeptidase
MRTPKKQKFEQVSLEELLETATVVETKPMSKPRAIAGLAVATVLTGLLVGLLATPPALAVGAGVRTAAEFWEKLPTDLPLDKVLPQQTILLDKDGNEFARLTSENRIDVKFDQIATNFADALVSAEDSRFYQHHGYDLTGIARAAAKNASSGDDSQGASTLTQQLVQNILIANADTKEEKAVAEGTSYQAKLREIKYAIALEKKWTKNQILTAYANAVYFGNGAYGVEAAAKTYFNTTAKNLTVAQSALLVAQVKSPSGFDPFVHPDAAKDRRDWILDRMVTLHRLTKTAGAAAKAEPIALTRGSTPTGCEASAYPYYCALARDEILTDPAFGKTEKARQETLRRGGLTLTTALDRQAMDSAQQAATAALGNDNSFAAGTAIVVPGTGHIAAVGQNRTWDQTQVVYATSPAQPGSSFKPIVLATALDAGIPATTKFYSNGPYRSSTLDSPPGGFTNDSGERAGTIAARDAIRESINVYFVKLIEKTGVVPVADMAHRLGINSIPNNLHGNEASLALGTYEATPLEMANAYSAFAGGGIICKPVAIIGAVTRDTGKPVTAPDPGCHQALNPQVAALIADILRGPLTGGTLSGVGPIAGHDTGAKTGTTDNSAAVWTVGITGQYAAAVWVGNPEGGQAHPVRNIRVYGRTVYSAVGGSVAGPIWKDTMVRATAGLPNAPFPARPAEGVTGTVNVDKQKPTIPDVRGLGVNEAVTVLLRAGITPQVAKSTADDDGFTAENVVVAQSPTGGKPLTDTVTLTLSHGSNTDVRIPTP